MVSVDIKVFVSRHSYQRLLLNLLGELNVSQTKAVLIIALFQEKDFRHSFMRLSITCINRYHDY